MLNRALRETYPPGSTFKLVTAAAALESGKYTRTARSTTAPRSTCRRRPRTCPTRTAARAHRRTATLTDALANSCNTAFGKIGLELGADSSAAAGREVRLRHRRSPCRCAAPSACSPSNLNPPQTAQSAIGQFDVRATPLQMAMVAAAIANRGVLMSPYLVQEVRGPDLSVARRPPSPKSLGEAMSPQSAAAAHRDDGQRRRQRHRHQRPDPRRQGRRQDRHRAAGRRAAGRTPGSSPSRRPRTRRSRWPSSSRTAATPARSAATSSPRRSREP